MTWIILNTIAGTCFIAFQQRKIRKKKQKKHHYNIEQKNKIKFYDKNKVDKKTTKYTTNM